MNSITDYLDQLQKLTQKNLEILQAINDSFFTEKNHIAVKIGDSNYAMPSFISLENKINYLQENLYNLLNAPTSGEADFIMNGNSRTIEVKGYTHTPNSIKMDNVDKFGVYDNNIFKDFLTPVPYINVDLQSLPNDITSVNIKKVIPTNPVLLERIKSILGEKSSTQYMWGDLYKILSIYNEGEDYIEYDTSKKLPIRKNIGTGVYVIEKILEDYIDQKTDNLDNYIKLKLRTDLSEPYMSDLSYRLFDETIYKPLKVGDELVTFDDSAKMQIIELDSTTNTILVKVSNGEYLNLCQTCEQPKGEEISDLCKIKFFSPVDFNKDKYIRIPLEEDQYIFTAVAPLNDRMNIQSPWGSGLILNTYALKLDSNDKITFDEYYKDNVKNIGDILTEITLVLENSVASLLPKEYNTLTKAIPVINTDNLKVIQINHHLNDSETVKNIRSLYSQKKLYKTELNEIQAKIDKINKELASISFDDTTGVRSVYTAQLTEYNGKKSELIASISKIIDEISLSVNNAEIPIENAKFRIRGFFDYIGFAKSLDSVAENHIKGIQVLYRYKNLDQPQSTAQSIGDFLFSDWNIMRGFFNPKISKYENGKYIFENKPDNSEINDPSFHQIDIPISQGETVDIKLRVIYDYGYPFIEASSNWSEIVSISFPREFLKDIQVLDIISENNNDIETNRFKDIIREQGIPAHIEDKIIDQDLVYFHRPENISSGFYTSERRIIPLKDKLSEMANSIIALQDEITGESGDSLELSIINGDISNKLYPFQDNNINMESYNIFIGNEGDKLIANGIYKYDKSTGVVSTTLNIAISNPSKHTIKLYSMFPGSRDNNIGELDSTNVKYPREDFENEKGGVWLGYNEQNRLTFKLQTANQFISFRIRDPYTGKILYTDHAIPNEQTLPLNPENLNDTIFDKETGMIIYPYIREENSLCLDNDSVKTYMRIAPGETIIIPLMVEYKMVSNNESEGELPYVEKTLSFDLRTSLYKDPVNYSFKVIAKLNNTIQDELITSNRKFVTGVHYKSTVVK